MLARVVLGVVGLFALVIVLACGGSVTPSTTSSSSSPAPTVDPDPAAASGGTPAAPVVDPPAAAPTDNRVMAWAMAQEFVKRQLRSPSTADFGSVFGDHQSVDETVTQLKGGLYVVKGWVDSQNGFGATVRTNFEIMLRESNGSWAMLDKTSQEKAVGEVIAAEQAKAEAERQAAKAAELERRRPLIEKAKWHTWRTADGKFSIDAKFVRATPDLVTIEKADGKTVDVPRAKLSAECLEFVKSAPWTRAGK